MTSDLIKSTLANVHVRMEKNSMGAKPVKFELVLYKYLKSYFTIPKMYELALGLPKETKYLGIILDSRRC